jgi:hypothetical protein
MKRVKFLLITISTLLLVNCKKGKDDPFISLRSRDHRIVGTWKLVKGNVIYTKYLSRQINSYTETDQTISGDTIYNTNMTVPCTFSININKDGSTEYDYLNSNTKDVWHWNDGVKNKSGIYLSMSTFIPWTCDYNFSIDRLTNKELILSYKSVETVTVNNVRTYGSEIELEFKKQ